MKGIPINTLNRFTDEVCFNQSVMRKIYLDPYQSEKTQTSLRQLSQLCLEMGCQINHLALAWIIKFNGVSSALIGARTS